MTSSKFLVAALSALVVIGAGCAPVAPTGTEKQYEAPAASNDQPTATTILTEIPAITTASTPVVKLEPSKPAIVKPAETKSSGITMVEVVKHNSAASCYSAIRASVYDLTNWIGKHPGGEEAIKALCGKNGTTVFEGQHGGSPRQESSLAGFKIGELAQ